MKTGSHNLGPNAFSKITIAKVEETGLLIRQGDQKIVLSTTQIALLKDILA